MTAVLQTWGSAMTHHPDVRMVVPGGGLSLESPTRRRVPDRATSHSAQGSRRMAWWSRGRQTPTAVSGADH